MFGDFFHVFNFNCLFLCHFPVQNLSVFDWTRLDRYRHPPASKGGVRAYVVFNERVLNVDVTRENVIFTDRVRLVRRIESKRFIVSVRFLIVSRHRTLVRSSRAVVDKKTLGASRVMRVSKAKYVSLGLLAEVDVVVCPYRPA